MGADHKGPLAAFVVVAIIAAVLLVTSVRSQADPGWWRSRLPSTVVAGPPASAVAPTGPTPAGVRQPAAPTATSTSASNDTAATATGVGATDDTQGTTGAHSRGGPGTSRHTARDSIAQQVVQSQDTDDPSDPPSVPGSPGPSEAAHHAFDPHRLPSLGPGPFLGHLSGQWPGGWPVAWQHWLSAARQDHRWGPSAGSRQHDHHRTH